jgi:uncharacterized protein (UPF0262 family)
MNPLPHASFAVHERIAQLHLHEPHVVKRKQVIEQERQVALGDLLRENYFSLNSYHAGPYDVVLKIVENRLQFVITSDAMLKPSIISLPMTPFRGIIKDYFMICESYFDAVSSHDPYKVEALDMGRRGIHNEGAEVLKKNLEAEIAMNFDTARRLFTLMCVLHIR